MSKIVNKFHLQAGLPGKTENISRKTKYGVRK